MPKQTLSGTLLVFASITSLTAHVLSQSLPLSCEIKSAYEFSVLAGDFGSQGSSDGQGSAVRFAMPMGVGLDASGTVFVSDAWNKSIRQVTTNGAVRTLAGSPDQGGGADGQGSAARFGAPAGLAVDTNGVVYVCDLVSHTVRKVTPQGVVSTLAGCQGKTGASDGTGTNALFTSPFAVALDSQGNLFVTDANAVRKVTPEGLVSTVAGRVDESGYRDGAGLAARFQGLQGIAISDSGVIFLADNGNLCIRRVDKAGMVTTLAGSPKRRGSADGRADQASFSNPGALAVNSKGHLFIGDYSGIRILKAKDSPSILERASSWWNGQPIWEVGHVAVCSGGVGGFAAGGIAISKAGALYVTEGSAHVLFLAQ
jgi:sugar lactone lactonase YvrE